ncbi:hypothetical protein PybrP1_007820 [[Pythium] brassicae (nom. inval.)]|nr:hypothetical protein PybrP1_007820 [[Pythium] brassicae (nom. inval.)]
MAARAADDVSLAQVEDELRAAEAYLHHCDAPSAAAGGPRSAAEDQDATHWQQHSAAAVSQMRTPLDDDTSGFFRRRQKTRPVLSEDRRKEILAKLSAERQALKLFQTQREQHADETSSCSSGSDPVERDGDAHSGDELFYASDIIGAGVTLDAQPRSHMDVLDENEHEEYAGDDTFRDRSLTRQDETSAAASTISRRLELLAQPRTDAFTERERQRIASELRSFADPRRQSATEGKRRVQWSDLGPSKSSQSVIQRLHLDGTLKYEQRERAKAELEARALRECTFTPKINRSSRAMLGIGSYKPIHERLFDIQRAQAESIQRVQEKLESEARGAARFTPTINLISREIAAKVHKERALASASLSGEDAAGKWRPSRPPRVVERLVSDAERQAEKRVAIQEYYDAVQQQPFAPTISDQSLAIVQQRPEFKLGFVARQHHFEAQGREKLEALEDYCERAQNDGERITFTPDIGNADAVLRELRPDRFAETASQRLYRLMYNEPKQAELRKQRLRDVLQATCTFKPEINPISKALGRPSTLAELARPVATPSRTALQQYFAGKRFRSRVALEMEQAARAECTFRPALVKPAKSRANANTNAPPAAAAARSSSSASKLCTRGRQGKSIWRSDNILHLIETDRVKRAEELDAKRSELELRELKECTFQPNIRKSRGHRGSQQGAATATTTATGRDGTAATARSSAESEAPLDPKPVIVRGLGRFLEMKEQAKRLRAEQKQREERAFRPNAAYEPRSYTVPKPFKLSESSKDAIRRRLRVRQELRAKEQRECTFAPRTIESEHRKVLANLLRD